MRNTPFALLGAALRMSGWLNGGAALVLVGFMLGIVGGDYLPPDDLRIALGCYLVGLLATGLGVAFAFLAQLGWLRRRPDGYVSRRCRLALVLALLAYLAALACFGAGGWVAATDGTIDPDGGDDASAVGAAWVVPSKAPVSSIFDRRS